MDKKEIGKAAVFDSIIEGVKVGGSEFVKQLIPDGMKEGFQMIVSEAVIETGVSVIPAIGNTVASLRVNRKIHNIEELTKQLASRIDEIESRVDQASDGDKAVYADCIDFAYESVGHYTQEEKIKYLVNGLVHLINTDDISYDISYLYINTLNRMTLLDIAVLKLYANPFDEEGQPRTYQEVYDEFNIEYEQYTAVQSNLVILGLLETKTDQALEKDLETLEKQIDRIDKNVNKVFNMLESVLKEKKLRGSIKLKKGNYRLKSKDKFVVSKFGREFYRYFVNV